MSADDILYGLEQDIAGVEDLSIEPLPCDKWLASSAWQKSIRRGKVEIALRAALTFWHLDRVGFWRRCLLVVLEDIGPGSPDVMVKVLNAYTATTWRRKIGDLRVALHVTQLMCGAVKCRLADHIYISAERSPQYVELRAKLAIFNDTKLMTLVLDVELPLIKRALALWYLAGMRRFPSDLMPTRSGSLEKAVFALKNLPGQTEILSCCLQVLIRTQYPLALFMPLLTDAVKDMPHQSIKTNTGLGSLSTADIPHYAADCFTRVGKSCLRELQRGILELKRFNTAQIGLGVFYEEGSTVNVELTSPDLMGFKQQGEFADIEGAGLCIPEYLGLRDCLNAHQDRLHDIRQSHLTRYRADWNIEQQGNLI